MRLYENAPDSVYEEIKSWYPVWYQNVLEMDALWRVWGMHLDAIQAGIVAAIDNNFIDTSDAETVTRLETFLGITYDRPRTLNERRRVIKALILNTRHIGQREIKEYISVFTDGEITLALDGGTIRVTVTRDYSDPFNLYDCTFVLGQKIPAHLLLELVDKMFPVSVRNKERFVASRFSVSGLRFIGDGARDFKPVAVHFSGICFEQTYDFTGSVTIDSQWYLDGTYRLDGTRHLDAGITTEEL